MEYSDAKSTNPDVYISSGSIQPFTSVPSKATISINGHVYNIKKEDLDKFTKSGTQIIDVVEPDFNNTWEDSQEIQNYIDKNISTSTPGLIIIFPTGKIAYGDSSISYDYSSYAPGVEFTYNDSKIVYDTTGNSGNLSQIFNISSQYDTTIVSINGVSFNVTSKISVSSWIKLEISNPSDFCASIKNNIKTASQRISRTNTNTKIIFDGGFSVGYYNNIYILYCNKNNVTTYINSSGVSSKLSCTTANPGLNVGSYLLFKKGEMDSVISKQPDSNDLSIVVAPDEALYFKSSTNNKYPPVSYIYPIRTTRDVNKSTVYPYIYYGGVRGTEVPVSLQSLKSMTSEISGGEYYVYKMPMYDVSEDALTILLNNNRSYFNTLKSSASGNDMLGGIVVPYGANSRDQRIVVFENSTGRVLFLEDWSTMMGKRSNNFFGSFYPIVMSAVNGTLTLPSNRLVDVKITNENIGADSLTADMSVEYYNNGVLYKVEKQQITLSGGGNIDLDAVSGISLSWDVNFACWVNGLYYTNNSSSDWASLYSDCVKYKRKIALWCTIKGLDIPSYKSSSSSNTTDINSVNLYTDSYLTKVMSNIIL